MRLSTNEQAAVDAFRSDVERRFGSVEGLGPALREDRPDGSVLASRFPAADRVWLEVTVRPTARQVRVGLVTDDRWKNEDFEDRIEESGDTMSEFVELGFDEAGLEWKNPLVEHFRDQGKYFCFATSLDLAGLEELTQPAVREKIGRMVEGYRIAFGPALRKMQAAEG